MVENKMLITKIIIKMTEKEESNVKAYVKLEFNECFIVNSIRIIESNNGLFIAMPSKLVNGKYIDICHPIETSFRKYITDEVIKEYKTKLEEGIK